MKQCEFPLRTVLKQARPNLPSLSLQDSLGRSGGCQVTFGINKAMQAGPVIHLQLSSSSAGLASLRPARGTCSEGTARAHFLLSLFLLPFSQVTGPVMRADEREPVFCGLCGKAVLLQGMWGLLGQCSGASKRCGFPRRRLSSGLSPLDPRSSTPGGPPHSPRLLGAPPLMSSPWEQGSSSFYLSWSPLNPWKIHTSCPCQQEACRLV